MGSFRFVHAADLHLDTPFVGLARAAPRVADVLRDASLQAWDRLVEYTLDHNVAFLILAGDLYDGPERGVRAQLAFARGLERLAHQGIQAFIVHGNHDPIGGWSAVRKWPSGVTIFGTERVDAVPVVRQGTRLATVYGISYARGDVTENLAVRFSRGPEPGLHIGVLHCNLGGDPDHAAYSPCSLDDLQRAGMDYWALGHVHRAQVVSSSRPAIVYPGSLQARSIRASEEGPKGAYVVEADRQGIQAVRFVPLDIVRLVGVVVDIRGVADLRELHRHLTAEAEEVRAANGTVPLVIQATLVGRGDLHRDLARPGVAGELLKMLRQDVEGTEPFCWWDSLRDRTRPAADLALIRQRGDFAAELLRVAEDLERDPERAAALMAPYGAVLGRAAAQRSLAAPDDPDAVSTLREGLNQALDLLERD